MVTTTPAHGPDLGPFHSLPKFHQAITQVRQSSWVTTFVCSYIAM